MPLSPHKKTLLQPPAVFNKNCYAEGSWFWIRDLYPVGCDVSFNPTLDKIGEAPISCEVTMSFIMKCMPTAEEAESWFDTR